MKRNIFILLSIIIFSLYLVSAEVESCTTDDDCDWDWICDINIGSCMEAGAELNCEDDIDEDHDGYLYDCEGECTTDDDCASDEACVIDTGDLSKGNCVACEDTDDGNIYVKGSTSGVYLTAGVVGDFMRVDDLCTTGGDNKVLEYYCRDSTGDSEEEDGTPGHIYIDYEYFSCPSGYGCKDGACVKSKISTSSKKVSKAKLGAAEYDVGSSLPWILGGVGILLIGGILYWHFKPVKKKGKKK